MSVGGCELRILAWEHQVVPNAAIPMRKPFQISND